MSQALANDLRQVRRSFAQSSLYAFAKTYLGRYVEIVPSPAHVQIYELLQQMTVTRGQHLAVAAPRGFGKTTMITTVYALYSICYATESFIVILSSSSGQAIRILDDVRKELETNTRLLEDFQELAGPRPSPWTAAEIVTPNRIKVVALGSKQNIRGLKYRFNRPSLVIADDLEQTEHTFSEESRNKLRSWLNASVFKLGTRQTNYCFLGTLHHAFCLLAEFLGEAHPHWTKKRYKAVVLWAAHEELWEQWRRIYAGQEPYEDAAGPSAARRFYEVHQAAMDEGTQTLWPERWTYYELMLEREKDLRSFNNELQNEPVNDRDCWFNVEEFSFWTDLYRVVEELRLSMGSNLDFYGACDPSLGKDPYKKGDYSAIIVLARDRRDGTLYIVVADIARRPLTRLTQDIFAYYRRFPFERFAIETNQFQEVFAQDVERFGREQGLYMPIERVINSSDKIRRIQTLQSLAKSGGIKFSRLHHLLLEQARFFPQGKYDDGLDALEMAVRMANQPVVRPALHIVEIGIGSADAEDEFDSSWRDA